MKNKIEKEFSRLELAEYLEEIAAQLRSGKFEINGRQWSVPEKFKAKIKREEKKGRIGTKLKWQWSTLSDYEPSARHEVTRWQDTFKSIKKRMAIQMNTLEKAVSGDEYPDNAILQEFVEHSVQMAEFADSEWQEAVDEYVDHLTNLQIAVQNRQLEIVKHELRDLRTRMKACHRDFK
jgi:XXXCH domain-containing protein